jgi:fimbrial chaperone protein
MSMKIFNKIVLAWLFTGLMSWTLLGPSLAAAGAWGVTPIMLHLGKDARSAVITVSNDEDKRLEVQMKAAEWTQDAQGKDIYEETGDIIFFPKILIFEKKEEKIIRAGIKIPAVSKEKTYRLFIEEIPEPRRAETTSVAIAIKFGVPIFVRPLKEELKGEVGKIAMSKGVVEALVKNTGNIHFVIDSISVRGENMQGNETFSKDIAGWYLLSGASRLYTATVPQDACAQTTKITVEIKTTEKIKLNSILDVNKTMCLP